MRNVELHEARVQDVNLHLYADLGRNDTVLFTDLTDVMKTGSRRLSTQLFSILDGRAFGALIHFHDIFWPFEYGEDWVRKENRSWNEIYGMHAFLMYNKTFEIVFFNDYFRRFRRDPHREYLDAKFLKNTGGSLWLRNALAISDVRADAARFEQKFGDARDVDGRVSRSGQRRKLRRSAASRADAIRSGHRR